MATNKWKYVFKIFDETISYAASQKAQYSPYSLDEYLKGVQCFIGCFMLEIVGNKELTEYEKKCCLAIFEVLEKERTESGHISIFDSYELTKDEKVMCQQLFVKFLRPPLNTHQIFSEIRTSSIVTASKSIPEDVVNKYLSLLSEHDELTENEKQKLYFAFLSGHELDKEEKNLKKLFGSWSSGNNDIDNFIQECQLSCATSERVVEWIPHSELVNIKYICNGSFGEVYKATWNNGTIRNWNSNKGEFIRHEKQDVALKILVKRDKGFFSAFFKEVKNYAKIQSDNIVPLYGVTQFPDTGYYAMVLGYCEGGNLQDYLKVNHSSDTLKDKLRQIRSLCISLQHIHKKNLVHKDLHDHNVLVENEKHFFRITDLGLSGSISDQEQGVYGIWQFIAPEVYYHKEYSMKSDIYSLGMLLWEIFAGCRPFSNVSCDEISSILISNDRPKMPSGLPKTIQEMIQRCWDHEASKRPSIDE
ncbi:18896_t:CDS:2, partial [Racocetra fulgida]